jgi:hypothetical protein
MRREFIVIAAVTLGLTTAACTTGSGSVRISPTPVPTQSPAALPSDNSGTTINATGSLPPTGPPGITGSVTHGQATITLTGGLTQTTNFPTLTQPAIWSPVPGAMTLSWTGADQAESMSVGGSSFSGQQSTTTALTFGFSVKTNKGPKVFRSQAGECTITLNPAMATQVGGLVFCTNLKSVDGTLTVNAQGSFSASG